MIKPRYLAGQAVAYAAFAMMIAWFASNPTYRQHDPDNALLKLSLTHAGQKVDECKQRSAEELAKLPPNMRSKQSCGRARNPVTLQMDIDGNPVFAETVKPAGLSSDGRSRFYSSREIAAGRHVITARLSDGHDPRDFNQQAEITVELAPRQVFVVDFDEENNRFEFK